MFGEEVYLNIINSFIKSGFSFNFFSEENNQQNNKIIYLRHDIDFSVSEALKLAKLENKAGIKANYFFMLSSNMYNLLSECNQYMVREIQQLGHEISLHFDPTVYTNIECSFQSEKLLFENIFNVTVKMVSIHRPSDFLYNNNRKLPGSRHTYEDEFFKEMTYISDSGGKDISKLLLEMARNTGGGGICLHVLLHPIWWIGFASNPTERLAIWLRNQYNFLIEEARRNCKSFHGAPKIFECSAKSSYQNDLKSYCPLCKESSYFMPYGNPRRLKAMCSFCGSLERHRLLWTLFEKHTDIFSTTTKILHVAAELCIEERLRKLHGENYITADLRDPRAMVIMDITDIQYPEETFDVIICSHVLEQIPDDIKAMGELHRVLKSGGCAILLAKVKNMEKTYEDFSITTPEGRLISFELSYNVRLYGMDFIDKLKSVGFNVTMISGKELLSKEGVEEMSLIEEESIYFCKKCSK